MNHPVSVIGLGVMGRRMIRSMHRYPGFEVRCAFDPDPAACAALAAEHPAVRIAGSAAEAIEAPDTTVVYVACPPDHHAGHAIAAFAARKAVFCEKPLGVDLATSRDLAERAAASGCVDIVNYTLASAAAVTEVERHLAGGAPGDVVGVDIRTDFTAWPEAWQTSAAGWLDYRGQGGFTREVISHWVYLTERLFGPATLEHAWRRYPGGDVAEHGLLASLDAGGVPVSIAGKVGGAGPDRFEFTVWGRERSWRIVDWNRLFESDGGEWQPLLTHLDDPRETGYERQVAHAARAVASEPHTMARFADALSVQVLIEAMLTGSDRDQPEV